MHSSWNQCALLPLLHVPNRGEHNAVGRHGPFEARDRKVLPVVVRLLIVVDRHHLPQVVQRAPNKDLTQTVQQPLGPLASSSMAERMSA